MRLTIRKVTPLAAFWIVIAAYYLFVASAGHWTRWYTWSALYDAQAEGFRQGHLYLPYAPSPALKALDDPLDIKNMRHWRWDHSYHGGHLYLYWGLVPAILTAAVKTMVRLSSPLSDTLLTYLFALARLVVGTLLLLGLARRLARPPPAWAAAVAAVVFAVAHPTPFLLARGAVYEVAILGGVAFIVAGLYFGFRAVFSPDPRHATRWLLAASASFGLAGGSRISLLPVVVLLAAFTGFARWRIDGGGRRRLLTAGLSAVGPAGAVIATHMLLNYLRFDSWFEFGAAHQMGWRLHSGLRFVVPNVWAYFFSPPAHGCAFPFLTAGWKTTRSLSPGWLHWPDDHQTNEPTAGLFIVGPYTWLVIAGVCYALVRRWMARRSGAPPLDWRWRWVWIAFALTALGSAAPLLALSAATMRYEADFASALLLLATLFGWQLVGTPVSRAGRVAAATLFGLLATATIVIGLLFGFTGYFDNFARHNPSLMGSLQQKLSVCPSSSGAAH